MNRAIPIVLAVLVVADLALAAAIFRLSSRLDETGEAIAKLDAAGGEERLAGLDAALAKLGQRLDGLRVVDAQGNPAKVVADGGACTRRELDDLRRQMATVNQQLDAVEDENLSGRIQEAIQMDRNISGMLEAMPEYLDKYRDKAIRKLGLDEEQAADLTEQFGGVESEFRELFTSYQNGQISKDELRKEFWSMWDGMDGKFGDSLNDWQMSLFRDAKPKILTQWGSWFPELVGGGTRGEALTAPAPAEGR